MHTPIAMEWTGNFTRKHTYRSGRESNVWFIGFACPTCGAKTSRPRNPFKGRQVPPPVCDGATYDDMTGRPKKRPAKLPAESKR